MTNQVITEAAVEESARMTITEFLEARIAEDEAVARAATPGPWFRDSGWSISAPPPEGWDGPYVVVETPRARNDSEFVARHDPARVLAECAAKRAILGLHEPRTSGPYVATCNACGDWWDGTPEPHPCPTIRALALIYKDHPNYDKAWAL